MENLLDTYLDKIISQDEYTTKKQKILNNKIELTERLKDFERTGDHWLEPAKKFLNEAQQAEITALGENFLEKKNFLKKIGSNLILRERAVYFSLCSAWKILYNSQFARGFPKNTVSTVFEGQAPQNSSNFAKPDPFFGKSLDQKFSKNSMVYNNWLPSPLICKPSR